MTAMIQPMTHYLPLDIIITFRDTHHLLLYAHAVLKQLNYNKNSTLFIKNDNYYIIVLINLCPLHTRKSITIRACALQFENGI